MQMVLAVIAIHVLGGTAFPDEPGSTSFTNPAIRYTVPEKPYVVLRRGEVEAVVVDNRAVNDDVLRGHRAGYSGVAALRHVRRRENLFVPAYAGLNFEHIHDGTTQPPEILFEPRNAPMELRQVDDHTAELYQRPTPHWGLESCLRYELLPDGAIEMTVECIPRQRTFRNGYIALFWASYIDRPESGAIHFLGHPEGADSTTRWIEAVSPVHGVRATHLGRRRPARPSARRGIPTHPGLQPLGQPLRRALVFRRQPRHGLRPSLPPSTTRSGWRSRLQGVARETQPGIFRLSSRTTRSAAATLWSCGLSTYLSSQPIRSGGRWNPTAVRSKATAGRRGRSEQAQALVARSLVLPGPGRHWSIS